jgi:hypothetical protein
MCSGSDLSPSSKQMWDNNFYDPPNHYVDGMFNDVYHQDIGGLWHCFTQIMQFFGHQLLTSSTSGAV